MMSVVSYHAIWLHVRPTELPGSSWLHPTDCCSKLPSADSSSVRRKTSRKIRFGVTQDSKRFLTTWVNDTPMIDTVNYWKHLDLFINFTFTINLLYPTVYSEGDLMYAGPFVWLAQSHALISTELAILNFLQMYLVASVFSSILHSAQ